MDEDQAPIRSRSGQGSKGPTRLKRLAKKRAAGETIHVDIDMTTGVAFGPNVDEFNNYLGVVSRERLSILINLWDDVSEVDQNMIWEDVLVSFTLLLFNDESPCLKYKHIDDIFLATLKVSDIFLVTLKMKVHV